MVAITISKPLVLAVALSVGAFDCALAQNNASAASSASAMPLGSIVGASAGAIVAVPVAFSTAGAVLLIKGVEASARGTVYVFERVSDGSRASVEVAGKVADGISTAVGTAVTVSLLGAGVALSVAGKVIAFIPNEMGKSLLHNEQVTK